MKYLKLYSNDESYMTDKPNLGDLWVACTQSENNVYYSSEISNSLCFTALEDNASVQIRLNDFEFMYGYNPAGWQDKSFYYKKNNDVEWTNWIFEDIATSKIILNKGEKLYVMSDSYNSCFSYDDLTASTKYYYFNINEGKISASGNIMSLLNFTPILPNYAFNQLFLNCTSLVSAPKLPATTLSDYCYGDMFRSCTSLTQVPELPATTLAHSCYSYMFAYCSSLTQAPELPATTLVDNCYKEMFNNCTKLNYIKALFTTTPSSACTNAWVNNVSPTGTFVKSKDATWTETGSNGIPEGWTVTTV